VLLSGAGVTLRFNHPNVPSTNWTGFVLPLREDAGWLVEPALVPPTRALFEAVLANVTDLQIRGEFAAGVDQARIDNVCIVHPLDGNLTTADFRSPAGEFSTLVRNPDGTFTRRLKDGTQIVFDENGNHVAEIDRNGNTTSYTYDAINRITSITGPAR